VSIVGTSFADEHELFLTFKKFNNIGEIIIYCAGLNKFSAESGLMLPLDLISLSTSCHVADQLMEMIEKVHSKFVKSYHAHSHPSL